MFDPASSLIILCSLLVVFIVIPALAYFMRWSRIVYSQEEFRTQVGGYWELSPTLEQTPWIKPPFADARLLTTPTELWRADSFNYAHIKSEIQFHRPPSYSIFKGWAIELHLESGFAEHDFLHMRPAKMFFSYKTKLVISFFLLFSAFCIFLSFRSPGILFFVLTAFSLVIPVQIFLLRRLKRPLGHLSGIKDPSLRKLASRVLKVSSEEFGERVLNFVFAQFQNDPVLLDNLGLYITGNKLLIFVNNKPMLSEPSLFRRQSRAKLARVIDTRIKEIRELVSTFKKI